MAKSYRKILIRVVEGVALGLVALDALLYLAVLRPLQNRETKVWTQLAQARQRVQDLQARVVRLERFRANLPDAEKQLAAFESEHIPPRRQGFSRAARLLRRLSEQSNLDVSGVSYRLDAGHKEPLDRLGIELNVEGKFSDLMKFTHALETASDMIVIREFSFGLGEANRVGMRLTADVYLTP